MTPERLARLRLLWDRYGPPRNVSPALQTYRIRDELHGERVRFAIRARKAGDRMVNDAAADVVFEIRPVAGGFEIWAEGERIK